MSVRKKKPDIAKWKPTEDEKIAVVDGAIFIIRFDKVLPNNPGVKPYMEFKISKTSYINQLDHIAHYINYFISHFDPENELITAYLHLKYSVDVDKIFEIPADADKNQKIEIIENFIEHLYDVMFMDTHLVENIEAMGEKNYLDDIENPDGKKVIPDKDYLESLEFTNEHVKIMLEISTAMKIMAPIMFHYLYINTVKLEKDSPYIYMFYRKLFVLFGQRRDGRDPVNMFNKLYVYIKSRVLESYSINSPMYDKRSIFGIDIFVVINMFIKKVIISENMVKYLFPENWDESLNKFKENIVGLMN